LFSNSADERRKTLDPGFRRDDDGNFTVASTTTVIPAKAGIQRLCFNSQHALIPE
jgi:hypothetical protein